MLHLPSERDPLVRIAQRLAAFTARWHRATLEGAEHLPRGPALLVGNHGLYGLDTPPFFHLVRERTGRFPVGLADRRVFGAPTIKRLLARVGGVPGTRANAFELLRQGCLVVCYPGGSREAFKRRGDRYRLRWEHTTGFAHVAIGAGVPVVPFAGLGVDDSYVNLGPLAALERRLGRYAMPLGVGLGPLPWPTPFRFCLGPPVHPPKDPSDAPELKARVQQAVEQLLVAA